MIKKRDTEFGSLPGGIPDTMHSEYLRGKLEVRNHSSGTFTKRGNDVWAERSGRTYHSDGSALTGGAMDFASPVSGSGMGNLSRLTGGATKKLPVGLVSSLFSLSKEVKAKRGGAVDALDVKMMMQRGANRASGTIGDVGMQTTGSARTKRKPSARNDMVRKIMKERGVSLPEASKIVKAEGLY